MNKLLLGSFSFCFCLLTHHQPLNANIEMKLNDQVKYRHVGIVNRMMQLLCLQAVCIVIQLQ